MKYLLDTCVVSDFVKGEQQTLIRVKNEFPSDIAVSCITVMEIQYGLALHPQYAELIKPIINTFLNSVSVINFNADDAAQAVMIRAFLKQQGRPIGSYDILLAGTALNHKLIFVTSNTKEFDRIHGLRLENWRQ
jgi:tRNA(fMet)-specific endonuclease VapC